MSEWIRVRDKKPTDYSIALVCNEKGWMRGIKATYHEREDVWVLYDPNYRESLTLDVTHYLVIPLNPPEEK